MRREYYVTYEKLYADYVYEIERRRFRSFDYTEYEMVRSIRRSIDRSEREIELRPDAKYFLLVNFHHLIVKPLLDRTYNREFIIENTAELEADIDSDVKAIVSSATLESPAAEITGHQIMNTIDRMWRELRTTKLELWG